MPMWFDSLENNVSTEYFHDKGSTDVIPQILPLDFSTLPVHPNASAQAVKEVTIAD